MSAWNTAAAELHRAQMEGFGDPTVTLQAASGGPIETVKASWDFESDEMDERRLIRVFLDEAQLASVVLKAGALVTAGGVQYRVLDSIEKRQTGTDFLAEKV